MKIIKPITARKLLATGLLLTTLPTVLKDFVFFPDFFRGAMLGLGIGLEIMSIILIRMKNHSVCTNVTDETDE